MNEKKVVIISAGSLGGYIGAMLAHAGIDVLMLDDWDDHIAAIQSHGLEIRAFGESCIAHPQILHLSAISRLATTPCDFILICAKLLDTEKIIQILKPHLDPSIPVVTMQNSMVDDLVAEGLGRPSVLGGIATGINVGMAGPGVIERGSRRYEKTVFQIGELDGRISQRAQHISAVLQAVDHSCVIADIRARRWEKLGINALTSGIAACCGLSTSEVYRHDRARLVMIALGHEYCRLFENARSEPASLLGVPHAQWRNAHAGDAEARATLYAVFDTLATKTADGFPSGMLRDLLAGRPTEVDYFNGYIAQQGAKLGVATPTHARLAEGVRLLSRTRGQPAVSNLNALFMTDNGMGWPILT